MAIFQYQQRFLCVCGALCLSLALIGCLPAAGTKATVVSGGDNRAAVPQGKMARIAVAQFVDKTRNNRRWWTSAIGDGMADQLATGLVNTNRFVVLERQALDHVLKEQDLGASGRIRSDTAAAIGQIEGAELLVVGAVTEFKGNASGTKASGSGSKNGLLGALLGGVEKAHLAIDIRIIDTRNSRILSATAVEGEATNVNLKALMGGYGGGALAGGLSGWQNTPLEKALRVCIEEAVNVIQQKVPANYYTYEDKAM